MRHRLSPRRRSLSPSYYGISISPREASCQKFKAEDEIAGDENTSRCYEPEYDLHTKNAGDRSDLVRWAILNGYAVMLMPEDDKFPYDDIEYLMAAKFYLKSARIDAQTKKSADIVYIQMVIDDMRLKKLELYKNPKTALQREVAKLIKRFEPEALFWRHDDEKKYRQCSNKTSDEDITTFGCFEKDRYKPEEEHSFELAKRNVDIVKKIEKDFVDEVKRSDPADYKKMIDRNLARVDKLRNEVKLGARADWDEDYQGNFMKKQLPYLNERDKLDVNEKYGSLISKIFG
jgi:hypothetical protein